MSIAGPISSPQNNPFPIKPGMTLPMAQTPPPPYQRFAPAQDQFNVQATQEAPPAYQAVPPAPPAYQPIAPGFTLDQFLRNQTKPIVNLSQKEKLELQALHPLEFKQMETIGASRPTQEGLYETLYMYDQVNKVLNPLNRGQLKKLLKQGILQNTKAEDGHSALYHIYAMLTTRRAQGYDPKELVNETVDILSRPYAITQKFGPLSEGAVQKILMVRNYPESMQPGVKPPSKLLTRNDLIVQDSGTCVSSSVMYYMADREPAELARHLNELTSPMNAFFEKVKLSEISPDNPAEALNTLKENQINYTFSGPGEVTVKVNLPAAGTMRAMDSQFAPADHRYRNAMETAYQSALTFLADHTYDPATDKMDAGPGEEGQKGLTEPKKTLMETIVKENGGVQSVTYQAVDSKVNPVPSEENNSYLFGYNRTFEQTTNDIIQSLKMKEPVVVGTTDTDETGAIVTGHEITITGAYNDPIDNQLKFVVADSDDQKPKLVVKSAKELIPTIHHAGMPLHLAQRINQEINANQGIMIPDANDAANFKLLQQQNGPMPSELQAAQPVQPQNTIPVSPLPVPAKMQTGFAPNNFPLANNPFALPQQPLLGTA